jgi:hypothetical protein
VNFDETKFNKDIKQIKSLSTKELAKKSKKIRQDTSEDLEDSLILNKNLEYKIELNSIYKQNLSKAELILNQTNFMFASDSSNLLFSNETNDNLFQVNQIVTYGKFFFDSHEIMCMLE